MDLKNDVQVIGLGNCGGKIAKIFSDNGYQAMFCNGSSQDLAALGNVKNIYKLSGFDGFGGNRHLACDALKENKEFLSALKKIKKDISLIIYACGGSTGSGLSSVVAQYLRDSFEKMIICMVPVLPDEKEAIGKHTNAYEAIQELMDIDVNSSFILDNSKSNGNLKWINESFFKLMDSFISDDSSGELNNLDKSERIAMLKLPGTMILASSIDKLTGKNVFCTPEPDKVCGQIGIIHQGGANNDVKIDSVIGEVGKPYNICEGYNGKKTLIAVSGLSYPITQVMKLGQLAMDGQDERKRNAEASGVQSLPDLNFGDIKSQKKTKKKSLMGYEALMALD